MFFFLLLHHRCNTRIKNSTSHPLSISNKIRDIFIFVIQYSIIFQDQEYLRNLNVITSAEFNFDEENTDIFQRSFMKLARVLPKTSILPGKNHKVFFNNHTLEINRVCSIGSADSFRIETTNLWRRTLSCSSADRYLAPF